MDDDETFLDNVIDKSVQKLYEMGLENARFSKLYFLGFSAGAVMSQKLACTRSQKIAGIASVSGILALNGNQNLMSNSYKLVFIFKCHF